MTDIQTRTERMAETCLELLDTDPLKALVQASNVWKNRRNKLETHLGLIDDIEIQQVLDISGIPDDKTSAKVTMAQLGYTMGQHIASLARDMNSDTVLNEINYRYFRIASVKDSTAIDRCQTIKNRASALIASPPPAPIVFADYNITAGGAADLQTAIDNFKSFLGKPKAAKVVKIAATEDLDHAFDDLDKILEDLDLNANQIRFTNSNLWEQWQAARKRDDTGIRHLSARIIFIDDATAARIGQGYLKVDPIGLLKKVSKRSIVSLKDSETGIGAFDLTGGAPYYDEATLPNVVIEPNKITRVVMRLKKAQGHPIIN